MLESVNKALKSGAAAVMACAVLIGSTMNAGLRANAASKYGLSGNAYVRGVGVSKGSFDDGVLTIGSEKLKKNIKAIDIKFANDTGYSGGLRYKVFVRKLGWKGWGEKGTRIGTKNMALDVEAVKIELTDDLAKHYSVQYRAYVEKLGDKQGWVSDGAVAGTTAESKKLRKLEIRLVARNTLEEKPTISYRTYRQSYAWEPKWKSEGEDAGHKSRKKRIEAISMTVTGSKYTGGITYRYCLPKYGYQKWQSDGDISASGKLPAQSKRKIEEIQVKLTGELAEHYDVYYRVYIKDSNKGWMGWAKNGEKAGSTGCGLYIQGLQMAIVAKDGPNPGNLNGIKSVRITSYTKPLKKNFKFKDFRKEYKTDKTLVGLDLSKYQGNIDFKKVKKDGCDFVILRSVVYNYVYNSDKKKYEYSYGTDKKFEQYYRDARAAGLLVGTYFFTCDNTEAGMVKHCAKLKKVLADKDIDFPVALDWENFDYYKKTGMTKKLLNKMFEVFEREMQAEGYETMLYSSMSKLQTTWTSSVKRMNNGTSSSQVWLAHWVANTWYEGDYQMWQVSDYGKINGISGRVDMDVYYIPKGGIKTHKAGTTPTPTPTPDPSATVTPDPSATVTPEPSVSVTPAPTGVAAPVPTEPAAPTATVTPSATAAVTPSAAATPTPEVTKAPTPTAKPEATSAATPTPAATPKATPTAEPAKEPANKPDNKATPAKGSDN